MVTPVIAGIIFVSKPFNVVYLLLGLASLNIFVIIWMFCFGDRQKKWKKLKENSFERLKTRL